MRKRHPYLGRPDYQFWRKDPALDDKRLFDPVGTPSFQIGERDKIATAGSCFAQHVARFLANAGFDFLVTEKPHPVLSQGVAAKLNYGLFTARYGNIYSTRQLRQLLERAYGIFEPIDDAWQRSDGRFVDPFRPQILPGGYVTPDELRLDRAIHLAAVRQAIEQMDIFVFTLGLTETWCDRRDGAVYPLAPGVAGGTYEDSIHEFHNLDVTEVAADLQWSLDFIRTKNPTVRFILTVSPVPLNATAIDRHVAVSTAYSKAVLRVAAEQVVASNELCDYFPSYEIITSPFTRAAYFEDDAREIRETGVKHVMSLFLKHYTTANNSPVKVSEPVIAKAPRQPSRNEQAEALMQVLCDEEAIDNE
ncbi:GSCFA domain-containing protein [Novosphingobium olei]|uniref:GSCFA domain-containing protein n=1 Tax=Novosphingobium olei TaxID=2728851 RepID=UPI003087AE28|nr:GSCFA domain-containing protein [Novosphingobium olei]